MSDIILSHIDKFYGNAHVLKDLNLSIADGDFMTLLGPSGCGKTTTLRIISGLENPQKGTISIDGNDVVDCSQMSFLPSSKRGLDLVFQSYALWPHMTVFDNVAFGLQLKKMPKAEITQKVENALKRMHILQYQQRYPNELSGGQQQRVAIARAIVSETKILLLDEPLSNLDAKLRIEMRSELKRLHQELGTTVVYVTHDQTEALTMSTKIALFFDGVLVQCDKPMDVYRNPATLQVADFIGNPKINFIEGDALGYGVEDACTVNCSLGNVVLGGVSTRRERLEQMQVDMADVQGPVVLAIRPEHIHIYGTKEEVVQDLCVQASVYSGMPAGSETLVQLSVGDEMLMAKCIGERDLATNEQVFIGIDTACVNLYDKESGKAILGMR